jgi:hypothetical protein
MANIADLYFPPPIEGYNSILYSNFSASYIHSAEAYWRQEEFHFISENIGAIPQPSPTNQVHMSQFHQFRFSPPVPIYQPPPPTLPRWRRLEEDSRVQAFRFIHSNIIHLADPDPSNERSPKRRRLNQPLFPPLSHPYRQPTDRFQTVIKLE